LIIAGVIALIALIGYLALKLMDGVRFGITPMKVGKLAVQGFVETVKLYFLNILVG
jgi:hypothetical protein